MQCGDDIRFLISPVAMEATLFNALCQRNYVTPDNAVDQKKIKWSRSSRLDKGVHATALVVSAKLELPIDLLESVDGNAKVCQDINEALPCVLSSVVHVYNLKFKLADVRVVDIERVAKSFHARFNTVRRLYHYYLPIDAFGDGYSDVCCCCNARLVFLT